MTQRKLSKGDKLSKLSASALNRLPELIAKHDQGDKVAAAESQDGARDGIIMIRNRATEDVPAFGVLGLDDAVFAPGTNLAAFRSTLALDGVKPAEAHRGKFAILLEPAHNNSARPVAAIVAGVTAAKVNVVDEAHTCADIDPEKTVLKSGQSGGAQILWKESGSGEKWAIVRLGGSPGAALIFATLNGPFEDGKAEYTLVNREDEEEEGEPEEEEEEEEPPVIWDEDDLFPRAREGSLCVAILDGTKYRAIFCQQIGIYAKAELAGTCEGSSPATITNFEILSPPPFHLEPETAPTSAVNPRKHRGATGRTVFLACDDDSETWQIVDMELVETIVLAKVGSDGPLRIDGDELQGNLLTIAAEHCDDPNYEKVADLTDCD